MKFGRVQDNFLELMLPVIGDSIQQAEQQGEGHADPAGGALDPSIAKALRRRQRGISSKKDLAEAGTVFKVNQHMSYCLMALNRASSVCYQLMAQVGKLRSNLLQGWATVFH